LDLKDQGSFKAASGLAGGVAGRGETCGALIGGIIAISQVLGRESLADHEQFQRSMAAASEAYLRFKSVVGHTICYEIHKVKYGRSFKLYEDADRAAFAAAGGFGPEGCAAVCVNAAVIAAEIIFDLKEYGQVTVPC
jgi:C_GCAxxG_C_C family probable redox protein